MQHDSISEKIIKTYEYLHAHPEISWEEWDTTRYIARLLEEAGCRVHTFTDCTGVIADWGPEKPRVALRADMDALWQNVGGTMQANHSCGHDAHMAMVLGVLWTLMDLADKKMELSVRFIFQPAEEVGAGALKMTELGALDGIDYLFGIHLRPGDELTGGLAAPAIIHGATASIQCEIKGDDAHGGRPHLTNNAINIGTHIVTAINTIHLDPSIPHSVKVTKFLAGGKNINIIPGQATLAFDLRSQTNEHMVLLRDKVHETLEATEQLFQSEIIITADYGIVAASVHPEAEAISRLAIEHVLGPEKTAPALETPGGDDFHYYTVKKPELKAAMVGLGCNLSPGLHHPKMTFDKSALPAGAAILTEIVRITNSIQTSA